MTLSLNDMRQQSTRISRRRLPSGNADRNVAAVTNNGVIETDSTLGGKLILQGGFFMNEAGGLIEARAGQTLEIRDSRIDNAGTIRVTDGLLEVSGVSRLDGQSPLVENSEIFINNATLTNNVALLGGGLTTITNSTIYNAGGAIDSDVFASDSTIVGGVIHGQWTIGDVVGPTLDGVTIDGVDFYYDSGPGVGVKGSIVVNATSDAAIVVRGDTRLTGHLQVLNHVDVSGPHTLTVDAV